jgi:alanine racemase
LSLPANLRPTWIEVNLDLISHNVREFRRNLRPDVEIMAVVKADGYGHGAVEAAQAALAGGATRLAVAFIEEGVELRRAGIKEPVLILSFVDPALAPVLLDYRLTPVVYELNAARAMGNALSGRKKRLPVHVKVDTGMGRLGVFPDKALKLITEAARIPGLELEGLMTHLATADEEGSLYTAMQLGAFDRIITECRNRGINIPICHAANSAAASITAAQYNMVRLGLSIYGYYPAKWLNTGSLALQPALSFKSKIIYVKQVPPGSAISYGSTYCTGGYSKIATVPVGYADGYSRAFSNRGQALVRGKRVPVAGRVCMDHLMLDVTGVDGVKEGDEVVFYGSQGSETITVEEMAQLQDTIVYELLCSLDRRVPRIYYQSGSMTSIRCTQGEKIFV